MASAVSVALAIGLASTMLFASASKVAAPWNLKKTLTGLGLERVAWPLVNVVIALEAAVGIGTALGAAVPITSAAAIILMALFAAAGIWTRLGHLSVSCSCFGVAQSKLGLKTSARATLLALGFAAYAASPPPSFVWIPPIVVLITVSLGLVSWLGVVSSPGRIGS